MSDKNFMNIKQEMEASNHFKDVTYTEKSKKQALREIFIRNLVSNIFVILVSLFLFYNYISNDDVINFMFVNSFMLLLVLLFVIIAVLWVSTKLDRWMDALRYQLPIQLFVSALIILFFIYQMFTPYFYSEQRLEEIGLEKVDMYYQLSTLNEQERKETSLEILDENLAFSMLHRDRFPQGDIVELISVELERNYYLYEMVVEVKTETASNTYRFEFDKQDGDFKIIGISMINKKSVSALFSPDRHKTIPDVASFATKGSDLCPEGLGAGAGRG